MTKPLALTSDEDDRGLLWCLTDWRAQQTNPTDWRAQQTNPTGLFTFFRSGREALSVLQARIASYEASDRRRVAIERSGARPVGPWSLTEWRAHVFGGRS